MMIRKRDRYEIINQLTAVTGSSPYILCTEYCAERLNVPKKLMRFITINVIAAAYLLVGRSDLPASLQQPYE